MKLPNGAIVPRKKNDHDMFIGWAKAPAVDRRFLLGALPLGLAAAGGISWQIAKELDDPGAGAWHTGATHKVTGVLTAKPYPMLRIEDASAPLGMRSILIVAEGKCTSALSLEAVDGQMVTVSGVLIQRKNRQMLEVPILLEKWLEKASVRPAAALTKVTEKPLGPVTLSGSIMDSKCFFGVMRPGRGRTHKACASLCIRGGIPPSFWARDARGRETVLLMTTQDGAPMPMDILPLVADAVSVSGQVVRVGDMLHLRANADAYQRITA